MIFKVLGFLVAKTKFYVLNLKNDKIFFLQFENYFVVQYPSEKKLSKTHIYVSKEKIPYRLGNPCIVSQ